jgi:hypothetical protein
MTAKQLPHLLILPVAFHLIAGVSPVTAVVTAVYLVGAAARRFTIHWSHLARQTGRGPVSRRHRRHQIGIQVPDARYPRPDERAA